MKIINYLYYYEKNKFFIFIKEFKYIVPEVPINWINGYPPLAEPLCGFYGETCQRASVRYMLTGLSVALFLFVAGAFLFK